MLLQLFVVGGYSIVDENERAGDITVDGVGVVRRQLFRLLVGCRVTRDRGLLQRCLEGRRRHKLDHALYGSRKENVEVLDMRVPPVRLELVENPPGVVLVVSGADMVRTCA